MIFEKLNWCYNSKPNIVKVSVRKEKSNPIILQDTSSLLVQNKNLYSRPWLVTIILIPEKKFQA